MTACCVAPTVRSKHRGSLLHVLMIGAFLLGFLRPEYSQGSPSVFHIEGWMTPQIQGEKPPMWLADDPVLGRLACPSLTRINPTGSQSEPLILRAIEEFGQGQSWIWKLQVRSGIFWWNQQELIPADVAQFLQQNLPAIVKRAGGGLWSMPSFQLDVIKDEIKVTWASKPVFHAYVLNSAAFWRPLDRPVSGQVPYECVGVYRLVREQEKMTLLPSETYRQGLPTLAFDKGVKVPSLWFKHPDNIDDKPPTHDPDRPYPCSRKVPLPYLTVIKWNPASTLLANEKMRYLLTAITPRGALLRSGAGSLGDLISGPIPRHHPGYDSSIRVRPFNLEEAMAEFDKMGFTKAAGSVYRTSPKGHELHLRLLAPAEGVHWIEGVLIDAYRAAGVRLTILRSTKGEASHDGQITGLFLDWPGLNFLPDFHSKTTSSIGFVSHRSKAFDTILAEYAVSLTTSKPNWALLKAIHGYLFELEPFTMLLHHFACLIPSSSIEGKVPKSINTLDPDWFRTMIMNSR